MTTEREQPKLADAITLAIESARLMSDLKCEDVVVLDVRGVSQVTNFVVVGTGTSDRQMYSVADDLVELGERIGHQAFRTSYERSTSWAIVDFVDVTAHLFEANARAYYDLEGLWGDGARVDWRRSVEQASKS